MKEKKRKEIFITVFLKLVQLVKKKMKKKMKKKIYRERKRVYDLTLFLD